MSRLSEALLRPSMHETHMLIAGVWSQRSTCSRNHVGAVLVRDGRTIASGYNGAAAGMPHCSHKCNCDMHGSPFNDDTHRPECASIAPCETAVHAEANIIAFAARHGVMTDNAYLYTTLAPCVACAKLLINAGVRNVVYLEEYRDRGGIELLTQQHVYVQHFTFHKPTSFS